MKGNDERHCDDGIGNGCSCEPDDDCNLKFLKLGKVANNDDSNRGPNGSEKAHQSDGDNRDGDNPSKSTVGQLPHPPSKKELRHEANHRDEDGVGSKFGIGTHGILEVAKVADDVAVEKDDVQDGVDCVGGKEDADKCSH